MTTKISEEVLYELVRLARPNISVAEQLFAGKPQMHDVNGTWRELVYCILAGSQVRVEIARKAWRGVLNAVPELACAEAFCKTRQQFSVPEIAAALRACGYRYHSTKARVIVAAARVFCEKLAGRVPRLVEASGGASVTEILISDVNGIGPKIANHWFRNIGGNTCTIDVHLHRLFGQLHILSSPVGRLTALEFANGVDVIRTLAASLGTSVGVAQYALWLAARGIDPDTETGAS